MSKRQVLLSFVAVCLVATLFAGHALSQTKRGGKGKTRGGARQGQNRMAQRIKRALELNDAEWKKLEPKVTKVTTLSRQVRYGGMRMRTGTRGGGRDKGGRGEGRGQTEVGKAATGLREVLDNKEATDKQIKKKLTALRSAREEAQKDLAKAQKELSEGLSTRQQAQLVLMRILD